MECFITVANAKSIINSANNDRINENEEVFHINFKWFSPFEVKSLLTFKLLFENPNDFFKSYEKRKEPNQRNFIFEVRPPSYHLNSSCDSLLASFFNYAIPTLIKQRGDKIITEYRSWYIENQYLLKDRVGDFVEKMIIRFGIETVPVALNYENSGISDFQDINLAELEGKIEELVKEAELFYTSCQKNRDILNNYGKISFIHRQKKEPYKNPTRFTNGEIWSVLEDFEQNFKTPITRNLSKYYMIKYNPELRFEDTLLQQLGFNPCMRCLKRRFVNTQDGLVSYSPIPNENERD
jgi:hypothetical protein